MTAIQFTIAIVGALYFGTSAVYWFIADHKPGWKQLVIRVTTALSVFCIVAIVIILWDLYETAKDLEIL